MKEPVRAFRVSSDAKSRVATPGAGRTLAPPNKPSLAVLPFVNISSDAEQGYFADGMKSLSKLSQPRGPFDVVISEDGMMAFAN